MKMFSRRFPMKRTNFRGHTTIIEGPNLFGPKSSFHVLKKIDIQMKFFAKYNNFYEYDVKDDGEISPMFKWVIFRKFFNRRNLMLRKNFKIGIDFWTSYLKKKMNFSLKYYIEHGNLR